MGAGRFIAVAVAVLAFGAQANAEPFRVTYAEPVQLQSQSTGAAQKAGSERHERLAFEAFGRRFELELEENAKVLSGIEPSRLKQLRDLTLFRGKVRGQPDSWVRLSLMNGQYTGAIWDGAELYSIEPRSTLRPHLATPPAGTSATLIYRLSDTQGGVIGGKCGTGGEIASAARSPLGRFKSLLGELKQMAAVVGTRELIVAMLADQEYASQWGGQAFEAMVRRMNIVDGIFDYQVDVNIVPADFRTFSAENSPFTSNDPEQLLFQVADYRSAAPQNQARGLTHLLTGKPLDGQTLGIAYISALCSNDIGVGLSQEQWSELQTAMVIAHELGHNFGADHDGVPGSACSSTPQTFLMAPFLGSSTTFSSCSLNSINAHLAGASCVTPARTRDLQVTTPVSVITAIEQEEFEFVADIESSGEAAALNIIVSTFLDYRTVLSASIDGGTCAVSTSHVNCEIAELAPGEVSRLRIVANAGGAGNFVGEVTATSSAEQLTTNNRVEVPIQVYARQSASITISPETINAVTDEPFDVTFTIHNSGVEPLEDATARFTLYNFTVIAALGDTDTCAFESGGYYDCALGTLTAGETRQIELRLSSSAARGTQVSGNLFVHAGSPSIPVGAAWFHVNMRPRVDLAIEPLPSYTLAVVGEPVDLPLVLRSVGTQAVADARITINTDSILTVEVVGENVECTGSAGAFDCSFGPMEPGAQIAAQLRLSSDVPVWAIVRVDAHPDSGDEVYSNSSVQAVLETRVAVDLRFDDSTFFYYARDGVEQTDALYFRSAGAEMPSGVEARIELPEGITPVSASLDEGECTIDDRIVTCSLAQMLYTYHWLQLQFVAAEPGTYLGSVTLSADEDADASNNVASLSFEITPNTDAAVVLPLDGHAFLDEARDWVFSVVNNRYELPDSSLTIFTSLGGQEVDIESATPSKGTCIIEPTFIECSIGTLDPNEVFGVAVRPRWTVAGTYPMQANFSSPYDLAWENNSAQKFIVVDRPGDIFIDQVIRPLASVATPATVSIEIGMDTPMEDSFIELDYDRDVLGELEPSVTSAIWCDSTAQPTRCPLGPLSSSVTLRFDFTPLKAGNTNLIVRVGARNDRSPANNEQTVALSINPPVQTTPNPPNLQPSGGGGGGGTMQLSYLLGLLLLMLGRAQRERATHR